MAAVIAEISNFSILHLCHDNFFALANFYSKKKCRKWLDFFMIAGKRELGWYCPRESAKIT